MTPLTKVKEFEILQSRFYLLKVLLLFYCFPLEKYMSADDVDVDDDDGGGAF